MIFTPNQVEELIQIIRSQHLIFGVRMSGKDIISTEDLELLNKYGVRPSQLEIDMPYVEQSFQFGRLAAALGNYQTKNVKYADFKKFIQGGGHRELTDHEKATLQSIKTQSFAAVKNLGGRVEGDLRNSITKEEIKRRAEYEKILREELSTGVINRKSIGEITRDLGIRTGDWMRDLGRLVETESHNAFEEGRASELTEKHGADVKVYKDVYLGACSSCVKAYLTGGIGSQPIIFKLSTLIANGSNYGRKSAQYRPVLGSLHPRCRCTVHLYEEGTKWDDKKGMFVRTDKYVQRYAYDIKIKIGNDNYQL